MKRRDILAPVSHLPTRNVAKGGFGSFENRAEPAHPSWTLRRNSDQAGGDGLWYVVRMLRWEPIWKAFEKRCGLLRAGSEARLSLDELSAVAGISRYHFAHVFARAIGQSAMRYMRGRRLSEAARVLANGGPDILTVALDFGYGSHEAFTRAFRDQFGITPNRFARNAISITSIWWRQSKWTTV